jgi:hypothetical protein
MDHQVGAMISPFAKRTALRLWCIRLLSGFSAGPVFVLRIAVLALVLGSILGGSFGSLNQPG